MYIKLKKWKKYDIIYIIIVEAPILEQNFLLNYKKGGHKMTQENKRNKLVRFLTLYRATSYDIIFFYPIQIIFLYQARGVSLAGNVILESMFWLFNLILLTASTKVVEKISARKATIIGSILWIISIALYLLPKNKYYYAILIFAELIRAIGLALKSVADFPLVTETLHSNGLLDDKYYRQVEGNCLAINCAGDAVMAIVSTSLMMINKDLPMWICLVSCVYGLALACKLPESNSRQAKKRETEATSYKEIMKSSKISKIIIHVMVVYGTFCYWESLGKDLLQEMEVSNISYGIIIFLLYVANSIGGNLAARGSIRKMFPKAKSFVTTITIGNLILFAALGVTGLNKGHIAALLVSIILIIQAILKTSYIVEMKSLLQADDKARIKIGNLLMSAEHLGKSIILAFASGIIELKSVSICYIFLFVVLIVPAVYVSKKLEI